MQVFRIFPCAVFVFSAIEQEYRFVAGTPIRQGRRDAHIPFCTAWDGCVPDGGGRCFEFAGVNVAKIPGTEGLV